MARVSVSLSGHQNQQSGCETGRELDSQEAGAAPHSDRLTDGRHEMLRTKYGLTGANLYRFVNYERELSLSEALAAALPQEDRQQAAFRLQSERPGGPLKTDS